MHDTSRNETGWEAEYGELKGLEVWTVYCRPKDHPDGYIARLFYGLHMTNKTIEAKNLKDLRELIMMMPNLVGVMRFDGDDPAIVETWL